RHGRRVAGPGWPRQATWQRRRSWSLAFVRGERGNAGAAATQFVHLALHALLGDLRFLRAVAVGQLLEHLGLAAGQHQPGAFDIGQLAAVVDDSRLLHDGRVQALAEGKPVDQQRGRDRTLGRRGGVFLGVAAQRFQALLLFAERTVAVGDLARCGVLALLHDLEQRIEPLRTHLDQSREGVGAAAGAAPSSSRVASATRLASTLAASVTSWPRKAWMAGQRATASSTVGSLPRW